MACRRWHPVQMWFVGLCHICRRCSSSDRDTGETPVQRHTGSRGPVAPQSIRRSTSTFPDSSLGVHRSPLRRHDHHCVVTRPSRRLDFGSGLPHPDRVPLLPFLPAPAVCYAASRSEDPLVRWSAGLLHPAADHGVRQVSDSLTRPRGRASTRRSIQESSPVARTLRSVPLLGSRRPCRHRASSFRTRSRSPAGVPSRRWSRARSRVTTPRCSALDLRAFFHRGVRCVRGTLPSRDRSMLPWALDRLVPDAAARIALPSSRWTFRLAARTASASPHPNVKGRQGVSALSGSLRSASSPPRRDDRARSRWLWRVSRRSRLGRIPDGPRRGWQWIRPERRSTASVRTPEGVRFPTSSRRISEETRSRPSVAPKSGGRWFELLPSVLPRLPAYMMERPLAADTHARRRVHLRATRAHPEGCGVEPVSRTPKDSRDERAGGPPGGAPLAARDSDNLQQAGGAGSGPDSRRAHRDGRDSIRRRSLSPDPKIGMTGAEAPWVRSVRTSHLWWRSVASTEVPAPRWTVIHPGQRRPESALLPFRGHRSAPGNPDRCDPDGQ
jgi:hypothetical protein